MFRNTVGKVSPASALSPFDSYHISDLQIGTLLTKLSDSWQFRVRTETGWPGVSIL